MLKPCCASCDRRSILLLSSTLLLAYTKSIAFSLSLVIAFVRIHKSKWLITCESITTEMIVHMVRTQYMLDRVWYCTQNKLVHYECLYYYYTRNFHSTVNANKKEFNATTTSSILQTKTTINKHITTITPAPQPIPF